MNDLYCPKCGEPFDQAELHDWNGRGYKENLQAFQTQGCVGLGNTCNDIPNANGDNAAVASALYDLLGDDVDCMSDMMYMAHGLGLDVR